jgi:putative transposase
LRAAVRKAQGRNQFHIDAWVVLPDHMHCLWTLPEGDADFPVRWWVIKTAFSKSLPSGERRSAAMSARGERGVWQRGYWEHTIRDEPVLCSKRHHKIGSIQVASLPHLAALWQTHL